MSQSFDFIVVGSGPAGSILTSTLARSPKHPSVLLLEAGSQNSDPNLRVDGQRWITFQQHPSMNWGYKTVPQEHCFNRIVDYSRGRTLGGSSAINFGVYTVGAKGDYDEWADIVQDEIFDWEHMQRRFKALETFHARVPQDAERYAAIRASDHGTNGPIHVGFAREWERDLMPLLDIFEQAGFPLNPDHNSGNPIGMSVLINSAHNGRRTTAADILVDAPDNLTILTDSAVQRLVIKDKKAVGVECNGTKYLASKEVILSAGALDSPKILLHSGIGPEGQLTEYNIPVIQDSPIGQGLRDHGFIGLVYSRTASSTDRSAFYGDQAAMDAATEQWKKDQTGDWAKFACEQGIGYFKNDRITSSVEFKDLPLREQAYLQRETVPQYEILTHFPVHWFVPDFPAEHLNYSNLSVFIANPQARGEAVLQSSDPSVPLKFDPKLLSHPYDRRAAVEITRDLLKVAEHPAFAKDIVAPIAVPKSTSDEDILDYWKATVNSAWHMTGTAKMGKAEDADAVVDSHFRVLGIEHLRVADMSVWPVLPSVHTQAPAYITGATCADILIKEYDLA